jgi:hypothetical protein
MNVQFINGMWEARDGNVVAWGRTRELAISSLNVEQGYARLSDGDSIHCMDEERKAALDHRGQP